ncbi:MAG TPA: DUF1579 family protein [Caulifigura sp.]|nr:DUF1579 family protein [Caulifigura sp.]
MTRFISGLMTLCVTMAAVCAASAQDAPKPGKEHQEMAKLAGKWKVTVTEGGTGGGTTGVSEFKSICNGMWLASDFRLDDGSFSGHGLDSYDPAKKKYVSVWVDSMSGSPLVFEGDWTEPGKTMVQTAKGPLPDGTVAEFRSVTKYPSDKKMNFELYMKAGGNEMKLMAIEYTKM